MSWPVRLKGEDLYHHVYAWGNDRHPIFKQPCHYQQYLTYLEKYSQRFKVDIIAYALMQWHVHLFIHDQQNLISDFMLHVHGEYAQYYNKSAGRVGHVFGERFNNRIVAANEDSLWLTRYIHRQAMDAGLVDDPDQYLWTSYRIYIGREKSIFLKHKLIINQFGEGERAYFHYQNFVMSEKESPIDWNECKRFKHRVKRGVDDICRINNINIESYKEVRGRENRKSRQALIRKLVREFGLKAVDIAEYFNISKAAVSKIMK